MLTLLRKCLQQILNDLDSGNTNLTEDEELELLTTLKTYLDKTTRMSKYQACEYLGISRATFDNYVREGKLPKGKKEAGFKELSWSKKELIESIKNFK